MEELKPRKIDICICAKNRSETIALVLEKIEKMIAKLDCNVILVDGFSIDYTAEQSLTFFKEDNGRSIIKQIKGDQTYIDAYNLAMSLTVSEYVAWIDSDDLCDENRLKIQSEYLDEHKDVDVVSCSVYFNKTEAIGNSLIEFNNEQMTSALRNGTPMLALCHFQSAMFRRKCLDIFKNNTYFYPEYIGGFAGEGFMYTLHFKGKKFANLNNTYYIYNRGILENSMSNFIEPVYANTVNELSYDDKKKEIMRLLRKYNKVVK